MLINRDDAIKFIEIVSKIKEKKCNIQTSYKILKLEKQMIEEQKLLQEIILSACEEYYEKDENGDIVFNESGGIKIKEGKTSELNDKLKEIGKAQIQVADIYFELDEFEGLDLTIEELSIFMNFIK